MFQTYSIGCMCDLEPDYDPTNEWNHGFADVTVGKKGTHNFCNLVIGRGKGVWHMITILGTPYKVMYKELENLAEVDCSKRTIYINPDAPGPHHRLILHEVIHAVFKEAGMTHVLRGYNEELEEGLCELLETGLWNAGYQLLGRRVVDDDDGPSKSLRVVP